MAARTQPPASTARHAETAQGTDSASARHVLRPFLARPGFLLARVNQIYVSLYGEVSKGETLAQADLLLLLASTEQCDQISLARAAGLDTSTTALILNNLETRGLVLREADADDRRRSVLHLTAAGRKRVMKARDVFLETQLRLEAPLNSTAVASLKRMLRHIGANPMSPAPVWIPEDREGGIGPNAVTGSMGFLSRRALQVSEAYFLDCTASLNLTPRQFSALFIVSRQRELNQAELSRIFGLDPATCAVILKNLSGRGLLNRKVSSADRRARLYSLTPAGQDALDKAQPLLEKSQRLMLYALTKADIGELLQSLREIVKAHRHRLSFPGEAFSD